MVKRSAHGAESFAAVRLPVVSHPALQSCVELGELSDRNLGRLARRAVAGIARAGSSFSNGSGDYIIAFSTAADALRTAARRTGVAQVAELSNDSVSPLFQAVAEATEEAIYNSLFMATTTRSRNVISGKEVVIERLPLAQFLRKGKVPCT